MSDPICDRVAKCVGQVLALAPDSIEPHSRLIQDLGADSLDLVELMYMLEEEFSLRLDKQDLSLSAQLGLPEEEVHQKEVVTPKALLLLRERYPNAGEVLRDGVTRAELASLLTVAALAESMRNKLPKESPC
jgi:acyl carrier protein